MSEGAAVDPQPQAIPPHLPQLTRAPSRRPHMA